MKKIQSSRQTWTRRTKIVTPCAHDGADHPPISTCFQENVLKWSRQTAVDTGFCSGGHWAGVFAEQESATQDGWLQLLGGQEGGQAGIVSGSSLNYPNYSWFYLSSEIPLLSLRSGDRAWALVAGRAKGRLAAGTWRGRPLTRGLEKEARGAITIKLLLLTSDRSQILLHYWTVTEEEQFRNQQLTICILVHCLLISKTSLKRKE